MNRLQELRTPRCFKNTDLKLYTYLIFFDSVIY